MPAINLLFVGRDGVFNCSDQIKNYSKKVFTYSGYAYPTIDDALRSGTILVIASHGNANGILKSRNERVRATEFATDCIMANISNAHRISKVVFLVCSAWLSLDASEQFSQLAPDDTLVMNGSTKKLSVNPDHDQMKINDILALDHDENGWIHQ